MKVHTFQIKMFFPPHNVFTPYFLIFRHPTKQRFSDFFWTTDVSMLKRGVKTLWGGKTSDLKNMDLQLSPEQKINIIAQKLAKIEEFDFLLIFGKKRVFCQNPTKSSYIL